MNEKGSEFMKYMKKLFILSGLFVIALLFTGCGGYEGIPNEPNEDATILTPLDVTERKIIYSVQANLEVSNMESAIDTLKANMENDEWTDEESIYESYATLIIRIKSDRLDAFITFIRNQGNMKNYSKTATDVSLAYQDTTHLLDAYLAEKSRLLVLYEEANMTEILQINQRIAQIDLEVARLQGILNEYDSLVDYSTVTLRLYEVNEGPFRSFGSRLGTAFLGGWQAVAYFFEGFVIVLAAIAPFALVFSPIVVGIFFFTKYRKKKKNQTKE